MNARKHAYKLKEHTAPPYDFAKAIKLYSCYFPEYPLELQLKKPRN